MSLREVTPNAYELAVSEFDTDDGISIKVVGEAFPRVSISSAGVSVGDGTAAPAAQPPLDTVAAEADGDYVLVATVVDNEATFAWVDAADYVNA